MTENEKRVISKYRVDGYSYSSISKMMDLSVNTIKTFCKRNGLGGVLGCKRKEQGEKSYCENCGVDVHQIIGRKRKRFCSDKCRNLWWSKHQDQVNRKAIYEYVCQSCKKTFVAYGNTNRKYCCHECYVVDRFGGVR